jgi:hypothetical protein
MTEWERTESARLLSLLAIINTGVNGDASSYNKLAGLLRSSIDE